MTSMETPSSFGDQPSRSSYSGDTPSSASWSRDTASPLPSGVARRSLAHFEILRLLGKGGMGRVYLAYEPLLHRTVALKVLDRNAASPGLQTEVARFLAEAVLTGRLTHGGIIPVYQVGFDEAFGYFYSMRYVRGRTLRSIMKALKSGDWDTKSRFSLPRLLDMFVRICEAVAHAHRNGILHRDLKPSNVMLTDENEMLVLDWGLAKDLRARDPLDEIARGQDGAELVQACLRRREHMTDEFLSQRANGAAGTGKGVAEKPQSNGTDGQLDGLTQAGLVVGTPWYMSPEQMIREEVLTTASDVYSLGVLLYQMLSGALPAESRDLTKLVAMVTKGEVTRISARPEAIRLPKALCDIVDKALSLDPEDRYADAGELGAELRLYLEGRTPLKPLARDSYLGLDPHVDGQGPLGNWECDSGEPSLTHEGLQLVRGTCLRTAHRSMGDFRSTIGLRARPGAWCLSIEIGEHRDDDNDFACHYEVRIGVDERPFIELLSLRHRVQRRFDVRLQADQYYCIGVELEDGYLRIRLDGALLLNYREVFPKTGGSLRLRARIGTIVLQGFDWQSRGAPLSLSYHFLPDHYFQMGRYAEARQLYLHLAESHPDREEGLMALYKAGLCSAELKENQSAFDAFSRLENTMLDHYCTLGLAHIGVLDGNLEWAWEALKSGYARHKHPDVRTDLWFELLNVLEVLGNGSPKSQEEKYVELLTDLDASLQETRQVTFEYLDLIHRHGGAHAVREKARNLIQQHGDKPHVVREALWALWRTGIDDIFGVVALKAVDGLLAGKNETADRARLLLLKSELCFAQGHLREARERLEEADDIAQHSTADRLWARTWMVLSMYLAGDYEQGLSEARETLKFMDRFSWDRFAYLLVMIALMLLRMNKREKAVEALNRARGCVGWWGTVAGCVLDKERWRD